MELKPNDRWLCRIKDAPLMELIIIEVSPSQKLFKCRINSGSKVGCYEWFGVDSWSFVEQLPSFPIIANESETKSSTEG